MLGSMSTSSEGLFLGHFHFAKTDFLTNAQLLCKTMENETDYSFSVALAGCSSFTANEPYTIKMRYRTKLKLRRNSKRQDVKRCLLYNASGAFDVNAAVGQELFMTRYKREDLSIVRNSTEGDELIACGGGRCAAVGAARAAWASTLLRAIGRRLPNRELLSLSRSGIELHIWKQMRELDMVGFYRFEESVKNRFGPSKYEDSKGALLKLLQLGTVEDYQREFEKLMNRVTVIPDSLLICFYISWLKLHLQQELSVSKPTILGTSAGLEANKVVNDGDVRECFEMTHLAAQVLPQCMDTWFLSYFPILVFDNFAALRAMLNPNTGKQEKERRTCIDYLKYKESCVMIKSGSILEKKKSNYSSFQDLRSSCNEDMVKYEGPWPSTTRARTLNEKSNKKIPPATSQPPGWRVCRPVEQCAARQEAVPPGSWSPCFSFHSRRNLNNQEGSRPSKPTLDTPLGPGTDIKL
ncbi:hypothetical protein Tco_1343943 [Tanacetum coccineum]